MHNPFRKSRLIYSAAVLLMKDRKVEDFMPLSSVKAVGLLATWSEVSGSFAVLPFRTPEILLFGWIPSQRPKHSARAASTAQIAWLQEQGWQRPD